MYISGGSIHFCQKRLPAVEMLGHGDFVGVWIFVSTPPGFPNLIQNVQHFLPTRMFAGKC